MTSTRTRILDAALASFVARGVAATTIEQVRAAAGVSIGSLYHHFGDRQGLVAALREALLRDYQAGFVATLEEEDEAAAGIAATVRYHVTWCTTHADAARFLLLEAPQGRRGGAAEAGLEEANQAFFRRVLAWLRPHIRYGAVRRLDLDTAYALWLGPAQERCRLWLDGRSAPPDDAVVATLADAAVRSLCTEAGTGSVG